MCYLHRCDPRSKGQYTLKEVVNTLYMSTSPAAAAAAASSAPQQQRQPDQAAAYAQQQQQQQEYPPQQQQQQQQQQQVSGGAGSDWKLTPVSHQGQTFYIDYASGLVFNSSGNGGPSDWPLVSATFLNMSIAGVG
jgi:hypothetical protein